MLVGSFDDVAGLDQAQREFFAAAFSPEEIVSLCGRRPIGCRGWWTRFRQVVADWRRASPLAVPLGDAADPASRVQQVLAAGGGVVLVRCTRLSQACEIIQRCGGRVGLWPSGPESPVA